MLTRSVVDGAYDPPCTSPIISATMKPKVIVTGASGVLGTAVYNAFKAAGNPVLGLAHSRATNELVALDLLDSQAVEGVFQDFAPSREHPSI